MIEKVAQFSQFKRILRDFPRNMKFCFAYGSGTFKQTSDPNENMLDLIFVVRNPNRWHAENLSRNPSHYAQPLRFLGYKAITKLQESWGAKVYYNTLVKTSEGRTIKYGVISEISLVEDLLDWNLLYLSGRLHKPVQVLIEPDEDSDLRTALLQNLHSAVHAALLLLPEHFTETDFYRTIAGLSYNGDFRMTFGEDKNKVKNIVIPQLKQFRELYAPILKHFDKYVEIPHSEDAAIMCRQDTGPSTRIHHLNQLPRAPQVKLVRAWSLGPRSKDTEDCLRALAHDPDCSETLDQCLREIVWKSSVSQSLKGILTAGLYKSVKYSWAKIVKMMSSNEQKKQLPAVTAVSDKVEKVVDSVAKKDKEKRDPPKPIEQ
ncbi:phosphatidate cytidylyltransferase, mitochondrial [Belonocnema kinseyi]|uniref:phosphatidate cytidylyltransferase, mitochondrial n=1 Tax=Belonocnema kinseyi TaxID=2817044 RepID=UPI00143D8A80|nr:phosphatidate cytidylyltransferase, mitochondrial [Belonocnema kinseyi]